MVLLDTNICIDLLNQRPGFEAILRRLDGRQQGEVALSAITLAELRFGIAASQRRDVNFAKLVGHLLCTSPFMIRNESAMDRRRRLPCPAIKRTHCARCLKQNVSN